MSRENTVTLTVSELLFIRAALLEGFPGELPHPRGHEIGASAAFPLPGTAREHALSLLGLREVEPFVLDTDPAWNLDGDPAFRRV